MRPMLQITPLRHPVGEDPDGDNPDGDYTDGNGALSYDDLEEPLDTETNSDGMFLKPTPVRSAAAVTTASALSTQSGRVFIYRMKSQLL